METTTIPKIIPSGLNRDQQLRLQQLLQLGKVIEVITEVNDIAHIEIAEPPPPMEGLPHNWTRITGALLHAETQIVIYEKLGGPPIADVTGRLRECAHAPIKPERVASEVTSVLQMLKNFVGNVDWLGLES